MNFRRNQRLLSRTSGFILIGFSAIKELFFKRFSYKKFLKKSLKQIDEIQKEDLMQQYEKFKVNLPKIETKENKELFKIQEQFLHNQEEILFRQKLETYYLFKNQF